MNKKRAIDLISKQLESIKSNICLVEQLEKGVIYKIEYKYYRYKTTVIASVNRFAKDSGNFQILAADKFILALNSDLTREQYRVYSLKDKRNIRSLDFYKEAKKINLKSFPAKIRYKDISKISEFKQKEAPLIVGYEYISPKFKKEYFNA